MRLIDFGGLLNEKKKIVIVILLVIMIPLVSYLGYNIISDKIDKSKSEKIGTAVSEIAKEKVDYVFVDINPSFMLTIKENMVNEVTCLNEDCNRVYDYIDVKE